MTWKVEPEGAVIWNGPAMRLRRAGTIHVTRTYQGRSLTRALEVATPPTIIFDMVVDGNRDIYTAALDGEDLVRLTTHPVADHDPTFAAGTIVFVSERGGNPALYAMQRAGGAERRLTTTADSEMQPALSPDGTRLAFTRGAGLSRVYIATADREGAVRPDPAHGHGGTLENAPAWSPDGRSVVFVSTAGGNPDLYRWSGDTAALLEGGSGAELEPAWSPDGSRLVFVSTRNGEADLYQLTLASGAVTRLTQREGSDGYPAWLPDGRIVYVAFTGTTPALRWLDPENPSVTHAIPLPGPPGNPAGLPR